MKKNDAIKKKLPTYKKRRSTGSFVVQKQWLDSSRLTDDLFAELDDRHGLAHKLLNKLSRDRFDKWFEIITESEEFKEKVEIINSDKKNLGLKIQTKMMEGVRSAMKYGYSVLFFEYIDAGENFEEQVVNPKFIKSARIIEKPEVKEIELIKDPESEDVGEIKFYHLNPNFFEGHYQDIKIHASRAILIQNEKSSNPESISMFKPMYNWLNMFDDIAWSAGQAFFRYAGGFPVLQIDGWDELKDDTREALQKQWKNVNSMIGWVGGKDDKITFEGAAGRALSPKEYFEVGLRLIAVSGDLPFALLEGVNAGAVTGSETNLKDYYSDISSRQSLDDQPIIEEINERLIETRQLPQADYEIEWNPLFEVTGKEIAEINKLNAETIEIHARAGFITKDMQSQIESGELVKVEPTKQPSPFGNQEPTQGSRELPGVPIINEDLKDQKKIKIPRQEPIISKFSKPNYIKLEKEYFKELDDIFDTIEKSVILTVKKQIREFSKDKADNIATDYNKVKRSVAATFTLNNKDFDVVIKKNIGNAVDEGIISASEELRSDIKIPKSLRNGRAGVVANEHKSVVLGVSDDINKDIDVNMGIFALNPPETFAKIEAAIVGAFKNKKERLKMGVGNEINSALNQGNLLGYEESGIVVGKEWISIIDGGTTDTCLSLNGEVVPVGEAFSSGDYAPPAAVPPHACRSSLRAVTVSEARALGLDSKNHTVIYINPEKEKKDKEENPHKQLIEDELNLQLKKKENEVLDEKKALIKKLKNKINDK